MSPRRRLSLRLATLVAAASDEYDETKDAILDAAEDMLGQYGLHRWTVEDVADRAGVGRSTVYRAFADRDEIVHGVLNRELRRTLADIRDAVSRRTSLEDRAVEAAVVGLRCMRGSLVERLLASGDPAFLRFLTVDAGPLITFARDAVVHLLRAEDPSMDRRRAAQLAEIAVRLTLSYILSRDTVLPLDDESAMRRSVRLIVRPLFTT